MQAGGRLPKLIRWPTDHPPQLVSATFHCSACSVSSREPLPSDNPVSKSSCLPTVLELIVCRHEQESYHLLADPGRTHVAADAVARIGFHDEVEPCYAAGYAPTAAWAARRLLPGQDCGQASCVNRSWRRVVGDDVLWKDLLRRDYGMTAPEGPDGALEPKFRSSPLLVLSMSCCTDEPCKGMTSAELPCDCVVISARTAHHQVTSPLLTASPALPDRFSEVQETMPKTVDY